MAKQTREKSARRRELTPVSFDGGTVWAFRKGREIYVALKPIVESLGLSWSEEHRKLRRNRLFGEQLVVRPIRWIPADPEAVCIPARTAAGWLFLLPQVRVKPALRAKLRVYQTDLYEAVVEWFEPIDAKMVRAGWPPNAFDVKPRRSK